MSACSWCAVPLDKDGLCQECFDRWPKCAVTACENKCCLRLNSKYCWPHTPGTAQQAHDNLLETEPEEMEMEMSGAEKGGR